MPFLIIFGIIAPTVLLSVLLYIYLSVFHNKKRAHPQDPYSGLSSKFLDGMRETVKQQIDDLSAYPCEEIAVRSHDGLMLFGRLYQADGTKPVALMFHGYRGSSYTELSGAALLMLTHGFSVIVTDQRAHGRSEGATVTFGIKERRDCVTWVDYVKKRFGDGRGAVLFGISMGAASVLMASELLSEHDVRAIVADCPYSSPREIIERVMRNRGLPPKALYPFVRLSALLFGRFGLGTAAPEDAVKNTDIPILLIHGEDDRLVPCDMSRKIKAAAKGDATLFTVKGAAHGASFAVGRENYVRAVLDFVDAHIIPKERNERNRT